MAILHTAVFRLKNHFRRQKSTVLFLKPGFSSIFCRLPAAMERKFVCVHIFYAAHDPGAPDVAPVRLIAPKSRSSAINCL